MRNISINEKDYFIFCLVMASWAMVYFYPFLDHEYHPIIVLIVAREVLQSKRITIIAEIKYQLLVDNIIV